MTQPLNPNTTLPMSLQVDKLEQIKQHQPVNQQGLLSRQLEDENKEKQKRVNSNNEAEHAKVRDDNSKSDSQNRQQSSNKNEENVDSDEDKLENCSGRGMYIDIKI